MKSPEKWLRWSPLLVFVLYVLVSVGTKERGARADMVNEIRPEAYKNCEIICDKMVFCALHAFGHTEENQARAPQLRANCYTGCLRKESKVESCIQPDKHCGELTGCVVEFLMSPGT